ncbi:MAG: RND transporter, partial [Janthinobacterium lividum]|nr:RND transporter [Janthinobacterium lividum]
MPAAALIERAQQPLKNKKVIIMQTIMQTVLTKIALAASLAVALSACGSVGQDFTAPANVAGVDNGIFRHGAGAADAAQLPKEWWRIYGDATLDRLEQSAL